MRGRLERRGCHAGSSPIITDWVIDVSHKRRTSDRSSTPLLSSAQRRCSRTMLQIEGVEGFEHRAGWLHAL